MKVATPMFIIHECERLIKELPYKHKYKAKKILGRLQKLNNIEDAIWIVDYMSYLENEYVYPHMTPQLFKRSHISSSLIKALEKCENKEEAKKMLEDVRRIARFESSWCEDDKSCNWDRTFNVVTSPTEWRRICARAKLLPSKGSFPIAVQIKKPKKPKTADKAWNELPCNNKLKKRTPEECYEIWFRQVERAIYYIYLP